jgi:hypothetical protein
MHCCMPAPYSAGLPLSLKERAVNQLDVDAAVLHRFDRAGDLDDATLGLLRIGIGAGLGELHAADQVSPNDGQVREPTPHKFGPRAS